MVGGLFKAGNKLTIFIIIAVVVIGLFVFIYFIGRRSGKVKIEQVALPTDQPNGNLLSNTDSAKVRQIAQALHDDMDGIRFGSYNLVPYNEMLQSSDTMFVAIYNDFNNLFSNEKGGTLREWLNSEFAWSWSTYKNLIYQITSRMDRLGLR
jgi:hypothetical protein